MGDMSKILKKARRGIMSLMSGRCDIQDYKPVTNPETHITRVELVTVYADQPCKMSFSKNPVTAEGDAPGVLLSVRLILPPELDLKAGAVIKVTQNGRTQIFKAASAPAVYTNHQEVELESADDYA